MGIQAIQKLFTLISCLLVLVSCARTSDIAVLQRQILAVNNKLEAMKSTTVGKLAERQANTTGQMGLLEQDIVQLRSQIEESYDLNQRLIKENQELQEAIHSVAKEESTKREEALQKLIEKQREKESQIEELNVLVREQEANMQAIQKARIKEAERKVKEAEIDAKLALQRQLETPAAASSGNGTLFIQATKKKILHVTSEEDTEGESNGNFNFPVITPDYDSSRNYNSEFSPSLQPAAITASKEKKIKTNIIVEDPLYKFSGDNEDRKNIVHGGIQKKKSSDSVKQATTLRPLLQEEGSQEVNGLVQEFKKKEKLSSRGGLVDRENIEETNITLNGSKKRQNGSGGKVKADATAPKEVLDKSLQITRETPDTTFVNKNSASDYVRKDDMTGGRAFFQKGNYSQALKIFERVAGNQHSSNQLEAIFMMGETHFAQKNYDLAVVQYQNVLNANPQNVIAPKAMLRQAQAFEKLADKETAKLLYHKIMKRYSSSPEAERAQKRLDVM